MEDLIIQISNFSSILRITNELYIKLYDKLFMWPIWMNRNCGRFFNSKSPKSRKLYSPISINSNDSQFNMWKDLIISVLPPSFFFWVNELFPILIDFNRFNPSILNDCTDPKQLFPISIDSTFVNCENSSIESWISV